MWEGMEARESGKVWEGECVVCAGEWCVEVWQSFWRNCGRKIKCGWESLGESVCLRECECGSEKAWGESECLERV